MLLPFSTNRGKMHPRPAHADPISKAFAISLGIASAEPEYACRVRGAQIDAVMRLTPLAMVASSLVGSTLMLSLSAVDRLSLPVVIWAGFLFAIILHSGRTWMLSRRRGQAPRAASLMAIWRLVLFGAVLGALWGAVPVLAYPGAPASVQVLVGGVTVGMICAGGFMLSAVPVAGAFYVIMLLAGATCAIVAEPPGVSEYGLLALLWVFGGVIVTCLCCNAHLFVEHVLAEGRLQAEIMARERAQIEVAHTQRMSALGALAGGVAHDFANILQSVTGNATLVARRPDDAHQARQLAALILDAADRGGAISRRLLAFARQDKLSAGPVDVVDILQGAAELLEHTLHRSITLSVCVPPDLPLVLADRAQLETVLVNLAANARDAMPRGGTLTFEAAADHIREGYTAPALAAGNYVRIAVIDNGTGMDAETLARAADPFFTTKPKGKGTGLGLAMAKGFAEHSGGALTIASHIGIGTAVTLWLPQAPERAAAARSVPLPLPSEAAAGRLLIVDDDADVRDSLVRALEDAGFDAIGVANGMIVGDLVERGLQIDLLITDYAMPGMNGVELLEAVHLQRPDLPAILLTGSMDDVTTASGARVVLLQKPVHPNQLIHHVRQSLAAQMAT